LINLFLDSSKDRNTITGLILAIIVLSFSMLSAVAAQHARAETIIVDIPAERDTMIAAAHKYENWGKWGFLWVKIGNGETRILVGFDLTPLASRADDVISATILLRAASHTFRSGGTSFSVYAYPSSPSTDWVGGNASYDDFAYCTRYHAPIIHGGSGATWSCQDDPNVDDGKNLGCPLSDKWVGGYPGFETLPTDTIVEARDYNPTCSQALSCYANGGRPDCWRGVSFDVTADVQEALNAGQMHPSWLVRRTPPPSGQGAAFFFSREGAAILGIPELGPTLQVELTP
jgi:hypothetical protein